MTNYKVNIISEKQKTETHNLTIKELGEKDVLVKIEYCAICTLEQRIYSGVREIYPFAGGHEMAGTIKDLGSKVKNLKIGDKVAVRTLNTCGECHYCRMGYENQCVDSYKSTMHKGYLGPGGFAEYIAIDAKSIYKVADDVELTHAALTEPLACCVHSVDQANIQMGETVVVIGVGIMGALHIQLAKLKGARVIACELNNERLQLAKKLGADIVINSADSENTLNEINKLTENRGADVVFCTVASTKVAEDAIKMTGKLGRAIMFTSFHPDNPIEISVNSIHSTEKVITGAVSPKNKDFFIATRLISNKLVDLSSLITDIVEMENMEEAYRKALDPSAYRILVAP